METVPDVRKQCWFYCTGLLEVIATEQSNLTILTWLAEAILVGQYWNQNGLLEQLQQQVRVSRGRMGQYLDCGMIYFNSSFCYHLLQIPIAQPVATIPPHVQQDDFRQKVVLFEQRDSRYFEQG
jgi:hypothetical protein